MNPYLATPTLICFGCLDDDGYSIETIAKRLDVSPETVRTWIRTGELVGVGTSRDPQSRKPRMVVLEDDMATFLNRRKTVTPPKVTRKKRGRKKPKQHV